MVMILWLLFSLGGFATVAKTSTILPTNVPIVIDSRANWTVEFRGIGAISGGGATSRLLVSYPEPQRSEILDYLFKPQFAASLQILKVEIGGDAQSTDGTEASHQHAFDEEPSFERGYEWWLMREAKKRNPNIQLWALPWAFPGWVDPTGSGNPYIDPNRTANYVASWIAGARDHHGFKIDMVGCWNERAYNADYLKSLRKALDARLLRTTAIIAPDGNTDQLAKDMLKNQDLFDVVDALGGHYPGTHSSAATLEVASRGGKAIFASEDYGVYFDASGSKAWARLLNQNYVNGQMSGTIAWNLVSGYYSPYDTAYYGPTADLPGPAPLRALPFRLCGLMHAAWPWSAHYVPTAQLYVSAHYTQFTSIGWHYLPVDGGSGWLQHGGSFVTLVSPDAHNTTIVIEKMSWAGSQSAWQGLPQYNTTSEAVRLSLPMHRGTKLALWKSYLPAGESGPDLDNVFLRQPDMSVSREGIVNIEVCVDCLLTLTTDLTGGHKGHHRTAPPPGRFPLPYADNFSKYELGSEADFFADQAGSFEIVANADRASNRTLRQMVTQKPCIWDGDEAPLSVIGDTNWTDTATAVDVMLEQHGMVWLGSRLLCGPDPIPPGPNPPPQKSAPVTHRSALEGRDLPNQLVLTNSTGVFLGLSSATQEWHVSLFPLGAAIARGSLVAPIQPGTWYRLGLQVQGALASGTLNGHPLFANVDVSACANPNGFAGIGTGGFYHAQFANIEIKSATPAIEVTI